MSEVQDNVVQDNVGQDNVVQDNVVQEVEVLKTESDEVQEPPVGPDDLQFKFDDTRRDGYLFAVLNEFNKEKPTDSDLEIVNKVQLFSACMVILNEFCMKKLDKDEFFMNDIPDAVKEIKDLGKKLQDIMLEGTTSMKDALEKVKSEYIGCADHGPLFRKA